MNQKEFTTAALSTEIVPERLSMSNVGLQHLLLLAISASKLIDILKRPLIYGKPYTPEMVGNAIAESATLETFAAQMRDLLRQEAVAPFNGELTTSFDAERVNKRLLHAGIGLFGEAGELLEALLEQGEGKELDMANVAEELFDTDWFLALGIDETGIPHQKIRDAGLAKLDLRKRKGLKNQYANKDERDLGAERTALEAGQAEGESDRMKRLGIVGLPPQ